MNIILCTPSGLSVLAHLKRLSAVNNDSRGILRKELALLSFVAELKRLLTYLFVIVNDPVMIG